MRKPENNPNQFTEPRKSVVPCAHGSVSMHTFIVEVEGNVRLQSEKCLTEVGR